MIVDFRALPSGTAIEADVCVIGTGPAGLSFAREFFGTSIDVVVLESGGLGFEPASEALNDGESAGAPYAGLSEGRRRQFGGAANIWGAVCVELDPHDFERRPWIAGSGWPLTAATIAPFYDRARKVFGLDRTDYGSADWEALGMKAAAFDPARLRFTVSGTAPVSDLAKAYRADFEAAANVRVLLHATVTALQTNDAGTAMKQAEFRSIDGKRGTVKARSFVLCCGGIENARLLLASRQRHSNGLGNGYDLVGRYLADHTFSISARITPAPGRTLAPLFRSLRRAGSNLRPRLSLAPQHQAQAEVLNCMAQVHFEHPADGGFVAAHHLRRAIRFRRMPERLARDVANVVRHAPGLSAMAFDRYVRGRHPAGAGAQPFIECIAEQAPDPDSRVTLGNRRDRLGLPVPVVDWRIGDIERRTIAYMTQTVAREFARLGLGCVEPQPWLVAGSTAWAPHLVEGFHHMGTTRMAASPRSGVVDADCKVHDVAGLYVAGSAIFPAAGYANGTLTIVAMAIRLADHLKHVLRPPLAPVGASEKHFMRELTAWTQRGAARRTL